MGELVNVVVAFAVIFFIFRWITSGNNPNDRSRQRSPAQVLGFRPKNVTQDMITTVSTMFPDIPVDNIRYDLLRSGSVEVTTNKILERGYLDTPPAAYYTLYPRTNDTPTAPTNQSAASSRAATEKKAERKETLISRFHLEERIAKIETVTVPEEDVGGKAKWEDTPEKREASLKERKAKMILAARQRMLAQQQQQQATSTPSSSSTTTVQTNH